MKPPNSRLHHGFHPLMGVGDLVIFDLETTGLRPKTNEITQIAAARLTGWEMRIDETFCTLVNPGRSIPQLASRLTGIRDEDVFDAPSASEGLRLLENFAGEAVLLGHDIYSFDFRFIAKHTQSDPFQKRRVRFVDTMDLFPLIWEDFSRLDHGLDEIAFRLDATIDPRQRHRADGDVRLLAKIFHRIHASDELARVVAHVPIHEGWLPAAAVPTQRVDPSFPTPDSRFRLPGPA